MDPSFRSQVTFTQRMNSSLEIAASMQAAYPAKDASMIRADARDLENDAFQAASSQDEYSARCESIIKENQKLADLHGSSRNLIENEENLPDQTLSQSEATPSQQIGPYSNCIHHATGLVSAVYKTRCLEDGNKLLAIKLTSPSTEQQPHNSKREARILSDCSHPHVISLHSTHILAQSNSFLLVFPFKPMDLEYRLQMREQLPKSILRDIFSALAYLHGNNILHRDLKPANILLGSRNGPAFVADFGIAWREGDPDSESSHEKISDVGTTCYRAPELLFGCHEYDSSIDLWAAGCITAQIAMQRTHLIKDVHHWSLFEAGELGSELALVKSIFETLGTPNEKTWPEVVRLPDWGKMAFVNFPAKPWTEILPGVGQETRELVSSLVTYQSTERICAADVLDLAFFNEDAI